ncbi:MAG: UTP--glucose-1-phosphate uridylyltransferase GalU [Acidobacteria bacterium]|nr:UTP--glucose-1-phosphate uridylyltransferase GalU [Acidobacteriota bacterium]
MASNRIRSCVIPCAGYGTRCLPATKEIPKEMLPLVDKPIIQYGVEEAVSSGMERVVIVTSRGKNSILDHFDRNRGLEENLRHKNKPELLELIEQVSSLAEVSSIRQKAVLGLGDAVRSARPLVGDEPFAVLLPDDVIISDVPVLAQLGRVWEEKKRPVVALMEVPEDQASRYGIIEGKKVAANLYLIENMVEKPAGVPPSNLAIIGRYLLTPGVFEHLEQTGAGAGGEIQLTDALQRLMQQGEIYGLVFEGTRYDAGESLGWLEANVAAGLRHPVIGEAFTEFLRRTISR